VRLGFGTRRGSPLTSSARSSLESRSSSESMSKTDALSRIATSRRSPLSVWPATSAVACRSLSPAIPLPSFSLNVIYRFSKAFLMIFVFPVHWHSLLSPFLGLHASAYVRCIGTAKCNSDSGEKRERIWTRAHGRVAVVVSLRVSPPPPLLKPRCVVPLPIHAQVVVGHAQPMETNT